MTLLTYSVDRDSVCAGDDTESHQVTLTLPAAASLQELIAAARRACPLASIAGGQATWLVDVGEPARCVAVVAQQWLEPRLLIGGDLPAASCMGDAYSLYFRYGAQSDPQAVFDALRTGMQLPRR